MMRTQAVYRSLYVRVFRLFARKRFRSFGHNVYVFPGVDCSGEMCIEIGDDVVLLDQTVLAAERGMMGGADGLLQIGSGCSIGRRNHIYAREKIIIGKRVITASNVYISDCTHTFENVLIPIMDQPVRTVGAVEIGDGAWIGQNACIIGCRIGKNSVIGANAVVLNDIPDHSVAVGIPAKVVRRVSA